MLFNVDVCRYKWVLQAVVQVGGNLPDTHTHTYQRTNVITSSVPIHRPQRTNESSAVTDSSSDIIVGQPLSHTYDPVTSEDVGTEETRRLKNPGRGWVKRPDWRCTLCGGEDSFAASYIQFA